MRTLSIVFIIALWPVVSVAQPCGDADGSGDVTLKDLALLCAHLTVVPGPVIVGDADVDGKQGLTIADMTRLNQYLRGGAALDCSGSLAYSIQESQADTIFVEYQSGLSALQYQVALYVRYVVDSGTSAIYLPMIANDPLVESAYTFHDRHYFFPEDGIGSYRDLGVAGDTFIVSFSSDSTFSGTDTAVSLEYIRLGGTGDQIQPIVVDRDSLLRPVVERNGELFHPVIQYVERPVLQDTMWITPASVQLISAPDWFAIRKPMITIHGSESLIGGVQSMWNTPQWIVTISDLFEPYPPAQVEINSYANGLAEGSYSDDLVIRSVATGLTAKVRVNLRVMQDPHYPIADFNCDGIVDVNDLARMIGLLVAGIPLPPSCN